MKQPPTVKPEIEARASAQNVLSGKVFCKNCGRTQLYRVELLCELSEAQRK